MARLALGSGTREYSVEVTPGGVLVDGHPVSPARRAYVAVDAERRLVFLHGEVYEFEMKRQGRRRASAHHTSLTAPMPASVTRVNVVPGAEVKKGDTLLVLEAMKMELPVRAAADGVVTGVHCRVGELVQPGVPLVEMDD